MEIKNFHSDYLESVRKLYLESRIATFTWLDSSNFELTDFDRDTEGEQIWLAMVSDQVVGFISIWQAEHFIHHLFVSPSCLRSGIGASLLAISKQHYPALTLKCLVANQNAVDFYCSQGFKITATVEDGAESHHLMKYSVITEECLQT